MPTGVLGTSQVYTVGGLGITAYGFTNAGTPTALFGKNQAGDEITTKYTGKIAGDTIKLSWEQPGRNGGDPVKREVEAKKEAK